MVVRGLDELLGLGVGGDEQAWGELVDRLTPAVQAAARDHRLTRAESEDLGQTVWLRLVDHHDTIRDRTRVAGWVRSVARNEAVSILRRRRGHESADERVDEVATRSDGPEEIAVRRRMHEALRQGLSELEDRCRDLLGLLARNMAYRDVAEALDMAVGSIGPTRERCLDKLRATSSVRRLAKGGFE